METTTSRTATPHTEGPWRVELLGHSLRVVEPSGVDVALIGDVREPSAYADARLIARAPAMQEALEVAASGLAEILGAVEIVHARLVDRSDNNPTVESLGHIREAVESLRASTQAAAEGK